MVKHGEKENAASVGMGQQEESPDVSARVRRTLEEMIMEMKSCGMVAKSHDGKRPRVHNRGNDSEDEEMPIMGGCDDDSIQEKEQSILELGEQLKRDGRSKELAELITAARPFLSQISKAKAAKLVRALVEMFLDMEAATGHEVELCKDCIAWATQEKRNYLRQSLESRLMLLYHDLKQYTEALALGNQLLKELKKLDDKNLLVEVLLCESKVYHGLGNLGRSRASLTTAKTTANGLYIPPKVQASLDMQSGILHAAEDRDFKTAFSYFYEAFEGYSSVDDPRAIAALKYMLLSKIMQQLHDDVNSIIAGKIAIRYAGKEVEAMRKIAKASRNRSLAEFQQALRKYHRQLEGDTIIRAHLDTLYDQMLEQNLVRIIEPYSKVQVDHVATSIAMAKSTVEKKLSQMILDKTLLGVLDQGTGVLVIFEPSLKDRTYDVALETIQNMDKVVDVLFQRATKLTLPIRFSSEDLAIPASA